MGGCTAHDHVPVIARVIEISASSDMNSEYGTAATTVRAFYYALEEGRGEEAATFIVPERRRGPFSPEAMTRFYRTLLEPLKLNSLNQIGENSYSVRYQFRGSSGRCDGRAIVATTRNRGRNYIVSIKALDGC